MRGARCFRTGTQEHPRQWAVTDEQRSRWPGAAPPRRAGAVWLSGVFARSLQTPEGYAPVAVRKHLAPRQTAKQPPAKSEFIFEQTLSFVTAHERTQSRLPEPFNCSDGKHFQGGFGKHTPVRQQDRNFVLPHVAACMQRQ